MSLMRKKSVQGMLATAQTSRGLRKELSAFDLTMLGIGAIIGTGIFVLTGTGATVAGPGLVLSFVISAFACGFAALCYAEFASMLPVSGSTYTYAYATLGEMIAWIIGWDLLLEYLLASSAVSVGWSGYFQSLLSGFGVTLPEYLTAAAGSLPGKQTLFNLPAFCVAMVITALLAFGIKESKRVNNVVVLIKVGVVLLFIGIGVWHVKPVNWQPALPFGFSGVFHGAAIVFFSFIGFDAVTCAAEEVKNPAKDIPRGVIWSLGVCSLLYVVVAAIMTGIVPYMQFAGVDHPVSLALQVAKLDWFAGFVDLGAILGMMTVILVMTYGQTRILFAMSRDGLLPKIFSEVNPRYGTPYKATWLIGTIIALLAGFVPLHTLAELVNIGTLAAFTLIALSVIVLRKREPNLPRKFVCPGVPYIPTLAILCCGFLMTQLSLLTWLCFMAWLLIGLVVYFGYSRRNSLLNNPA
ncbi:amino acid permease [Chromobacterium haemolyticum]|uniref:Amino acid permease n=4 Tax=Chromobacteriaceae TaxID=1499392 RepID=A0ABS3GMG1_9NEIS|nr:amino acid permease [Chromobacterium rhizoryzae]MBK0414547.1 amino acid permease [Chromobacterium haemolyticum]AXT45486.1 amino acid permease [Chromobacterium rhizoryzae]MBO0415819.1 amino acid permease [Chromobacterium haemolyticum]MBO0499079.1 amino acid permease [Chromobacterium haemolyticum]MDH0341767.1 amino acid permease [Chromobacterium haemolyticum]